MITTKQLQDHAKKLGMKVNGFLAFRMKDDRFFQFMFTFPQGSYTTWVELEFRVGPKTYHLKMTPEQFLQIDGDRLWELHTFNLTHNEQYEELQAQSKELLVLAKSSMKNLLEMK